MSKAEVTSGVPRDPVTERKRWPVRFLGLILVSVCVSFCVYVIALVAADRLLSVRNPVAKADIIVVLGGDGPPRAARAAALWREGVAPRVLVSGDGDCNYIRRAMIARGVDGDVIDTECLSSTTWENAKFSSPILRRLNVRKAVLVTSWFHSRRAIDSFSAVSRDIQWASIPAELAVPQWTLVFDWNGIQILKEYIKVPLYDLRNLVLAMLDWPATTTEGFSDASTV